MKRISKIKKVKDNNSIVIVESEGSETTDSTDTKYKRFAEPHPDFTQAFNALVPFVRTILDLPVSYALGGIHVTGVTISLSEDTEVEGATITGTIDLPTTDSPFNFNTPHLPFDQYSEGGVSKLMPEDAIDAINELRREGREYLDGKRAQGDLFREAAE